MYFLTLTEAASQVSHGGGSISSGARSRVERAHRRRPLLGDPMNRAGSTDSYDLPAPFRQDTSAAKLSHRWLYFGMPSNQWPRACAREPRRLGMIFFLTNQQRPEPRPGANIGSRQWNVHRALSTGLARGPCSAGHLAQRGTSGWCSRGRCASPCRGIAPSNVHGSGCRRAGLAKRGALPGTSSAPRWGSGGGLARWARRDCCRPNRQGTSTSCSVSTKTDHARGAPPRGPPCRDGPLGATDRPMPRAGCRLVDRPAASQPHTARGALQPAPRPPRSGVAAPETGAESPLAPAKGANLMRAVQIFFEPALPSGGALAGAATSLPPTLPPPYPPDRGRGEGVYAPIGDSVY